MDTKDYNMGFGLDGKVQDGDSSIRPIVLLVDDEPINIMIGRSMLENNGYNVVSCVNGVEAVEEYKKMYQSKRLPYAVLMDLQMPEKDGFEATRDILSINNEKQNPKVGSDFFFRESIDPICVPIIAYTTLKKDDIQDRLDDCGFSGYMYKPAKKEEFLSVLRSYARSGSN